MGGRSVEERRQNPKTPNPTLGIQTQHKRENWERGRRRREEREKDRDLSSKNTSVVCCVKRDITVASPMALNTRS